LELGLAIAIPKVGGLTGSEARPSPELGQGKMAKTQANGLLPTIFSFVIGKSFCLMPPKWQAWSFDSGHKTPEK
jgi:hypothetical protein